MRLLTLAAVLVFLAGCATTAPELSREEQLEMRTERYPDHKPEEVIQAAERVLTYIDEEDTEFAHRENGFLAERFWTWYAVLAAATGYWYWDFTVEPDGSGGTEARLAISSQSQTISGTATGGGGAQATSTSTPGRVYNHPASYELFWARVDYFLGEREEWPYCENWVEKKRPESGPRGSVDPLCGVGVIDKVPEGASKVSKSEKDSTSEGNSEPDSESEQRPFQGPAG